MAFATKPKLDTKAASTFVSPTEQVEIKQNNLEPEKENLETPVNKSEKPSKYPLAFPNTQMHIESKMAALKAGKTLREYILDLVREENKKYL